MKQTAQSIQRSFIQYFWRIINPEKSQRKITFPSIWANSCCSHPLHIESEVNGIEGAKNAAKKLEQELGINPNDINVDNLQYITKMRYKARADLKWVEYEIDYIFAMICDVKQIPIKLKLKKQNMLVQNN